MASGGALVLSRRSAALPHGTIKHATLREMDVVLIERRHDVEGYDSDVRAPA